MYYDLASILFLMLFVILGQSIFFRKHKKFDPIKAPTTVHYLIKKCKLDMDKVNYKKLISQTIVINTFIMFVAMSATFIPIWYFFQMLVAFIIVIGQIIIYYHFLTKYYIKKGLVKNV